MNELKYLETYNSKNTVDTYKTSLSIFLKGVYGDGELVDLASRYFQDNRNYESDVQGLIAKIKDLPPKTVHLRLSAVRTFLLENNVELRQIFWRNLSRRIQGNDARTDDRIPTNVELRRILSHMPIQGKALYLTMSSSGMRIGETLKLKLEDKANNVQSDIDFNHDPVQINLRGEYTKNKKKRVTFISGEAKEAVQEWLRCRDDYIKSAVGRSHIYKKKTEDYRLFPFDKSTANFMWVNAINKAELNHKDSSTKRFKIHIHTLRKFFRTRLGAVISMDAVEQMMGHEGYMTKEYRRLEPEDLAKDYKKGESALIVMGGSEESAILVSGLTNDMTTLKEQYTNLESVFNKTVDKIIVRIKNLENRMHEQEAYEEHMNEKGNLFKQADEVEARTENKKEIDFDIKKIALGELIDSLPKRT